MSVVDEKQTPKRRLKYLPNHKKEKVMAFAHELKLT